jgi:hypothetical protein
MRLRARTDDNQGEIDAALVALGWLVWPTSRLGGGFPDRVAMKAGRIVFIEVKDGRKPPSRRKLTPAEENCHEIFRSAGVDVLIVETVADLAILDREARSVYEGRSTEEYYKE